LAIKPASDILPKGRKFLRRLEAEGLVVKKDGLFFVSPLLVRKAKALGNPLTAGSTKVQELFPAPARLFSRYGLARMKKGLSKAHSRVSGLMSRIRARRR